MADLDLVAQISGANHGLAIVSVVRPDGSIHSSLVNAGVLEHPVTGGRVVGCVLGGAARKLAYLRLDFGLCSRSPERRSLRPRSRESCPHALLNDRPLKLGEHAEHSEHRLARGSGRIECLLV